MRFANETESAFWRYIYGACMNVDGCDNETACEEADQALQDFRERQ